MINFKLKNLDDIIPVGQEPNLRLSWFWLTDGDLWLDFDKIIIYEYSQVALNHFGTKLSRYNDYYIVRFIEDFTALFDKISETVPEKFYSITENLQKFNEESENWLELHNTDENDNTDFYFDEYYKMNSWISERTLDSAHLIGGPKLYFFRKNDIIRIIWETEYVENGISFWTAENGSCEMDYDNFVNEIKLFGEVFFNKMDNQVELVLSKDFKNINIDKKRLVEEHQERKEYFWNAFKKLEQEPNDKTDWTSIEQTILNK